METLSSAVPTPRRPPASDDVRLALALGMAAERGDDIVAVVDPTGVLAAVSPSLSRLTGLAADALVGVPVARMLHPDDAALLARLDDAVAVGDHFATQTRGVRVRTAAGLYRYVNVALLDARSDPRLAGLVAVGRPATVPALAGSIARAVRRARDLPSAFDDVGALLAEVVPACRSGLSVVEGTVTRCVAAYGLNAADVVGLERVLPAPVSAATVTDHGSVLVTDTTAPDGAGDREAYDLGARSYVMSPIVVGGATVATLTCVADRPAALDEEHRRILHEVVSLVGTSLFLLHQSDEQRRRLASLQLRTAMLSEEARTDALTSLPNRRAWDEALPSLVAEAERDEFPLCVAMLDLDHFKAFNDEHGHQAGDLLLAACARRWGGSVRRDDVVARYGGEEFAVALPECSLGNALTLLETLARTTPEGQTVSVGLVQWRHGQSAEQLVGEADVALYQAKRQGRNRVVAAQAANVAIPTEPAGLS